MAEVENQFSLSPAPYWRLGSVGTVRCPGLGRVGPVAGVLPPGGLTPVLMVSVTTSC